MKIGLIKRLLTELIMTLEALKIKGEFKIRAFTLTATKEYT